MVGKNSLFFVKDNHSFWFKGHYIEIQFNNKSSYIYLWQYTNIEVCACMIKEERT